MEALGSTDDSDEVLQAKARIARLQEIIDLACSEFNALPPHVQREIQAGIERAAEEGRFVMQGGPDGDTPLIYDYFYRRY
jgi:hypothetical protein